MKMDDWTKIHIFEMEEEQRKKQEDKFIYELKKIKVNKSTLKKLHEEKGKRKNE